jgi:hypothetical protein
MGKVLEGLGHGALFGALLGYFQWLVLHRRVANAHQWIIANVLGWSLGAALGDGTKAILGSEAPIKFAIAFLVYAMITAFLLVRIFQQK